MYLWIINVTLEAWFVHTRLWFDKHVHGTLACSCELLIINSWRLIEPVFLWLDKDVLNVAEQAMVQDRMTAARLETSQELTKDLKNAIVYGFQKMEIPFFKKYV